MSNLKKMECAGKCGVELVVDRHASSARCYPCIMADRPAHYHRHFNEEPDPSHQLELGEEAS